MSGNRQSNLRYSWLTLKNLVIAKLVVLGFVGLFVTRQLSVGEKPLEAQSTDEAKKEETKPADAVAEEVKEESPEEEVAEEVQGTKRRSFLEGLLNLPKIDKTKPTREEIGRFLDIAEQKQRQVESRIEVLKQREEHLTQLENLVEGKIKALEDEKVMFEQSIQQEKKLADGRVKQVIDFYKKMDAKKAAPVIEKLDKDLVVRLFQEIPQKQITKILSAMSAEKSVEITEYFGRVRSGREYDMLREMNQFLVDKFQECKGLPQNAH